MLINKSDLPLQTGCEEIRQINPDVECMTVSAMEPETLRPLKEMLRERIRLTDRTALTQPRHLDAVRRALQYLSLIHI